MKSTLTIFGLVLVLAAGLFAGYYAATHRPSTVGIVTPTPTVENMIVLDSPKPGSTVSSPLKLTGRARGNWYFEASFPVILKKADGTVLVTVPAEAQADWMTTDWVPFQVTLTFPPQPAGTTGTLVLKKDNPSGEPQFDDSRIIPIVF